MTNRHGRARHHGEGPRAFRWAVASCALLGCSVLSDLDSLGGSEPAANDAGDASLADASDTSEADGAPDGAPDVSGDTSVTDAPADATPDSPADATDSGGGCDDLIVDDFGAGPVGSKWNSVSISNGALSLDSADFVSPPSALHGTANPGVSEAWLSRVFTRKKRICCEVTIKSWSENIRLVELSSEGTNYAVAVGLGSGNLNASESYYSSSGVGIPGHVIGSTGVPGSFTRYRLVVEYPPGKGLGSLSLHAGGTLVISGTIGSDLYDLGIDTIRVGVVYAEGANGGEVRFDDLTCGEN